MYSGKSAGPRMEPWGTPALTGISRGKVKNLKIPGMGEGGSKKYVLDPTWLFFFWNSPLSAKFSVA